MVSIENIKNAAEQVQKAKDNLISAIFNFVLNATDDGVNKIQLNEYVDGYGIITALSISDYTNLVVSWKNDDGESVMLLNECDFNLIWVITNMLLNGKYIVASFDESDFGINKL